MAVLVAEGQGVFNGSNSSGRTRIGSFDGPLADTNILGQFVAGPEVNSLNPVGSATAHSSSGVFAVGNVAVPDVPAFASAFVQLWAWNSVWGNDLTKVPADQIGATDIVPVLLTRGVFPDIVVRPLFTQPAVVPVPEPRAWAIGGLVLILLCLRWCMRHGGRTRVPVMPED